MTIHIYHIDGAVILISWANFGPEEHALDEVFVGGKGGGVCVFHFYTWEATVGIQVQLSIATRPDAMSTSSVDFRYPARIPSAPPPLPTSACPTILFRVTFV